MHARKRKVLAEHLLFFLWPVIHYRIWKINKRGGGGGGAIKLRGWEKYRKINKRGGGGTSIWHLRVPRTLDSTISEKDFTFHERYKTMSLSNATSTNNDIIISSWEVTHDTNTCYLLQNWSSSSGYEALGTCCSVWTPTTCRYRSQSGEKTTTTSWVHCPGFKKQCFSEGGFYWPTNHSTSCLSQSCVFHVGVV